MRGFEFPLSHRNRPVSSRDLTAGPNRPSPPPHQLTYSRKPTSNRVKAYIEVRRALLRQIGTTHAKRIEMYSFQEKTCMENKCIVLSPTLETTLQQDKVTKAQSRATNAVWYVSITA